MMRSIFLALATCLCKSSFVQAAPLSTYKTLPSLPSNALTSQIDFTDTSVDSLETTLSRPLTFRQSSSTTNTLSIVSIIAPVISQEHPSSSASTPITIRLAPVTSLINTPSTSVSANRISATPAPATQSPGATPNKGLNAFSPSSTSQIISQPASAVVTLSNVTPTDATSPATNIVSIENAAIASNNGTNRMLESSMLEKVTSKGRMFLAFAKVEQSATMLAVPTISSPEPYGGATEGAGTVAPVAQTATAAEFLAVPGGNGLSVAHTVNSQPNGNTAQDAATNSGLGNTGQGQTNVDSRPPANNVGGILAVLAPLLASGEKGQSASQPGPLSNIGKSAGGGASAGISPGQLPHGDTSPGQSSGVHIPGLPITSGQNDQGQFIAGQDSSLPVRVSQGSFDQVSQGPSEMAQGSAGSTLPVNPPTGQSTSNLGNSGQSSPNQAKPGSQVGSTALSGQFIQGGELLGHTSGGNSASQLEGLGASANSIPIMVSGVPIKPGAPAVLIAGATYSLSPSGSVLYINNAPHVIAQPQVGQQKNGVANNGYAQSPTDGVRVTKTVIQAVINFTTVVATKTGGSGTSSDLTSTSTAFSLVTNFVVPTKRPDSGDSGTLQPTTSANVGHASSAEHSIINVWTLFMALLGLGLL